jgi:hypothetical protein
MEYEGPLLSSKGMSLDSIVSLLNPVNSLALLRPIYSFYKLIYIYYNNWSRRSARVYNTQNYWVSGLVHPQ